MEEINMIENIVIYENGYIKLKVLLKEETF